jgi:hypothetical protein
LHKCPQKHVMNPTWILNHPLEYAYFVCPVDTWTTLEDVTNTAWYRNHPYMSVSKTERKGLLDLYKEVWAERERVDGPRAIAIYELRDGRIYAIHPSHRESQADGRPINPDRTDEARLPSALQQNTSVVESTSTQSANTTTSFAGRYTNTTPADVINRASTSVSRPSNAPTVDCPPTTAKTPLSVGYCLRTLTSDGKVISSQQLC